MILTDEQIAFLCTEVNSGMIHPFVTEQVRFLDNGDRRVISYGLSSMGYDLRLAGDEFKVFSPIRAYHDIDPKEFDRDCLVDAPVWRAEDRSEYFLIPPHSYALGVTLEEISIPRDVLGLVVGKSTYARSGLIVNTTPLEPGWRGRLVLEFSNSASLPIRLYIGEGIGQLLLFRASGACETSYGDRSGKYQGQQGLVLARV